MKNKKMTKKIIAAVIAFVIIFSAIGCEAESASGGGTTANGEATSFTPTVAPNTSAPDLTSAPTEETTTPDETTVPDVTTATPETTLTPETTTAPIYGLCLILLRTIGITRSHTGITTTV